ncbi:MAG: hypothetical protein LBO80_03920 [Treponema sp.]|jgi:hypothetical protein|nr:hypothetical protein [Treponema sp.]
MEITINGVPADITLETEKTIGDLLSGLENWLEGSGHYLSGLTVDGKVIGAAGVASALDLSLEQIGALDIKTSTWSLFVLEALYTLRNTLTDYEAASFDEQKSLAGGWTESAAARFLAEKFPGLSARAGKALAGEGLSPGEVRFLAEERIREIENPRQELGRAGPALTEIVKRLEDLSLDIQTGKDGRAAETVSLFAGISEKIFRLLPLLKSQGLDLDSLEVEGAPFKTFLEEFTAAVKELLAAYETKDAVLAGDLAEYELAPRLGKFYAVIRSGAEAGM